MLLRKNNTTFLLSPERTKSTPYLFENIPDEDPHLRPLLFDAFILYFFQKLEILEDLHKKMEERDPEMYGHLAAIFVSKSFTSKDFLFYKFFEPFVVKSDKLSHHRQIFLSHLLTAKNLSLRSIGLKLIPHCPINELSEVLDYCKKIASKLPRSARTVMKKYIKELEKDEREFDKNLLTIKNKLKHLYTSLHIKPSERVQAILFEGSPPPESLAWGIKILHTEFDAEKIFDAIEKYSIPYSKAIANIKFFSYAIAEKFIEKLSPETLAECYPILKQRGITKNEDLFLSIREKLKNMSPQYESKLGKLITNKSLYQMEELRRQAEECLVKLREDGITLTKRITLLIDRSGSIYDFRDIAKGFIYILGNLSSEEIFNVYLFDRESKKINVFNTSEWIHEFDYFNMDKSGSCFGAPLAEMAENKEETEIICIISDGNENASPLYSLTYPQYMEKLKSAPYTILIKTGYISESFEKNIEKIDIPVLITEFTDYYHTISEIIHILAGQPTAKVIEQIINTDLASLT